MICLCDVSKKIGNQTVLDSVTATFQAGSITGFQGINGSGKTMLLRIIAGLVKPSKGSVAINGKQLWKEISMPESMGALIESPSFLDSYSGIQNLSILASLKDGYEKHTLESALLKVGLNPADKRHYGKYSLGMKQRLGIAAAIMNDPEIVLLDEPTNALDEGGILVLHKVILEQKERGATVLLASHDKEFLESLADNIFLFDEGKVRERLCD